MLPSASLAHVPCTTGTVEEVGEKRYGVRRERERRERGGEDRREGVGRGREGKVRREGRENERERLLSGVSFPINSHLVL